MYIDGRGIQPDARSLKHDRFCLTRHCEERSDEAIQRVSEGRSGLLRFARNDGGNQPETIML
jgi:hypothetical protein